MIMAVMTVTCGPGQGDPITDPPATAAAETAEAPTRVLVLGDVSNAPLRTIESMQPLADYLAARLVQVGVGSVEVRIVRSLADMTDALTESRVDLYFDSPVGAREATMQAGAEPILRRWKGGAPEYHSVIFALADAGIETEADLEGRILAFDEPYSTSGYVLPAAHLLDRGLDLGLVTGPDDAISPGAAGYVFTSHDQNTIQWVISGRAAAGAVDNLTFAALPPETRASFVIVGETGSVVRQLVLARAGLDAELARTIVTVLSEMHANEEGRDALRPFDTARFDALPPGTNLQTVGEMLETVGSAR